MRKECGLAHFLALFLESAETPLLVQIFFCRLGSEARQEIHNPKPQKCPKVVRRGCKGVLDPRSKGLPRVFCTTQTLFGTTATLFCTSARGLWHPWPKDLLRPLLTTFGNFQFSGPLPGPLGRKIWMRMQSPHLERLQVRLQKKVGPIEQYFWRGLKTQRGEKINQLFSDESFLKNPMPSNPESLPNRFRKRLK